MELVVQPDNLRLSVQSGQNLLDVLRDNAVPISYSCMSGRCGTCRCKVTQGELSYSGPEAGRQRQSQPISNHALGLAAPHPVTGIRQSRSSLDGGPAHPGRTHR